jgi:hypothetical protein
MLMTRTLPFVLAALVVAAAIGGAAIAVTEAGHGAIAPGLGALAVAAVVALLAAGAVRQR